MLATCGAPGSVDIYLMDVRTKGFVWLGLDGVLSPAVTHKMAAAFVLYAQGLLPFVIPLSVLVFEPTVKSRRRMLPFLAIGTGTSLYMLWALIAYPLHVFVRGDSIVYINDGTNNTALAVRITSSPPPDNRRM